MFDRRKEKVITHELLNELLKEWLLGLQQQSEQKQQKLRIRLPNPTKMAEKRFYEAK